MTAALKRYSPADYLALERASPTKHEFFDGEIFDMARGSIPHSRISTNVLAALCVLLKGRTCQVFNSDLRVKVPRGLYTYPDATVVCGELQLEDEHQDLLLNPLLIVEVLSPSTEAYDRGAKFAQYRSCPSLSEYVLVSQDHALVEHFARQPSGQWLLTSYDSLDARVSLPCLNVELPLSDVYVHVQWERSPEVSNESPPSAM